MENLHLLDRLKCGTIDSAFSNEVTNDESKMEVVKAFNNELVSLYDIKPPISKAKMTAITKAAMKSVKFYKHVVHGVEKFILKCRPDYKIPGLYVIDSIVRQSRHQFGVEKDVFAPRFSKNLLQTFKNICSCPEHDKQKLVRVINLWQKHKVFPEELLKKFLVMAEASEDELPDLYKDEIETIQKSSKKSPSSNKKKKKSPIKLNADSSMTGTAAQNLFYSGMPSLNTAAANAASRSLNHNDSSNKSTVDPTLIQQLQTLTTLLQQSNVPAMNVSPAANGTSVNDQVKFDKKLLEYDYGEEEDEAAGTLLSTVTTTTASTDSIASILTNPEILRQLHTLQVQLSMAQAQAKQFPEHSTSEQQKLLQNYPTQPFTQPLMQPPYQHECNNQNFYAVPVQNSAAAPESSMSTSAVDDVDDADDKPEIIMEKHGTEPLEVIDLDHIATPPSEKSGRHSYSLSRSRSRSKSPSRSRRRGRRSRSRSWHRDRSRDYERNEERRRRALPPIKRKHLAVCSTTLWVGHLSKLVQEQDLSDTFGEFGDIVSIDLIPPRGCAFLCMNRRQDADRALHRLKNTKIQGKAITIAWAPGKGMKGREWKDYWEVDYGVSYIPWNKLSKETDYDLLEEGGMLDQETMPEWLTIFLEEKRKMTYSKSSKVLYTPSGTDMDESSNDGDENMTQLSYQNTEMVIEPVNGASEQLIPLPDGPQPAVDLSSMRIPLPPGQNTAVSQSGPMNLPPPTNLLGPFGLSPRLLTPMSVLSGNFIPPLGVPPPVPGLLMSPQHMLNRLPPPFPGPPGLPIMNTGTPSTSSLSQIPLPDSSTATQSSSSDFKQTFGLAPPLIFPGNPNIKIDLSGNSTVSPVTLTNPDSRNEDTFSMENNNGSLFQNAFKSLLPFNENANMVENDTRTDDIDYRILGDMAGAHSVDNNSNNNAISSSSNNNNDSTANGNNNNNISNDTNKALVNERIGDCNEEGKDKNNKHASNEDADNYNNDKHKEFDVDRNYGRFHDRISRNYDRDRDKYHDRSHRFGGGRSPCRDDGYDNDRYKQDRDSFRRSRFDNRDYKRGRDFRDGWSRDQASSNRLCGTSRERDRFRDIRRDYNDPDNKTRRYERNGGSRERSNEDNRHNIKRSRWSEKLEEDWNAPKTVEEDWNAPKSVEDKWNDPKLVQENWDDPTLTQENWGALTNAEVTNRELKNETSVSESGADSSTNEVQNRVLQSSSCNNKNPPEYSTNETSENTNSHSTEMVEAFDKNSGKTSEQENKDRTDVSEAKASVPIDVCGTSNLKNVNDEITENIDTLLKNSSAEDSNCGDSANVTGQKEDDSSFQNNILFPRLRETRPTFVNRLPAIGRTFGLNSPSGPFPGLPNFQRPRFLGHRPHPSFFQGSARHFSQFTDSRPPRPFASSRSNNFL